MSSVKEKSSSLIGLALYLGYAYLEQQDSLIKAKLIDLSEYIGIATQLQNDLSGLIRLDVYFYTIV